MGCSSRLAARQLRGGGQTDAPRCSSSSVDSLALVDFPRVVSSALISATVSLCGPCASRLGAGPRQAEAKKPFSQAQAATTKKERPCVARVGGMVPGERLFGAVREERDDRRLCRCGCRLPGVLRRASCHRRRCRCSVGGGWRGRWRLAGCSSKTAWKGTALDRKTVETQQKGSSLQLTLADVAGPAVDRPGLDRALAAAAVRHVVDVAPQVLLGQHGALGRVDR
eukprot:SAG22_NODE_490_length_9834_cov_7.723780_10_plen_225_part_00